MTIGDAAPGFSGRDQHGSPLSSEALFGARPVLLVFFPWAFSGICRSELAELRDAGFDEQDVSVVAVSCDAMFSQRVWADAEGFAFPMLSDHWPHGAVAKAYGVFDEKAGVALRGTFLIDGTGTVRWSVVNGIGEPRDFGDYRAALDALR